MANDMNVPGFTANPDLQAKLDSLDDSLEPITKDLKEGTKNVESEVKGQESPE